MLERIAGAALLLIVGTGAGAAQTYMCPGMGDMDVRVTFIEGTNAAIAEFLIGADNPSGDEEPVTLRARPGGAGFTYVGGDLTLSGGGDAAELTMRDNSVTCALDGTPPPAAPVAEEPATDGEALGDAAGIADISAVSLGGNLRAGPGTEFEDVGGVEEGTEITLLADTGVLLNGFHWWQVELPGGQIAFQWGGVICVPGGGVSGVTQDQGACDAPAADVGVDEAADDASGAGGIPALSLGGNLRSGPGTAFPDVGGLEDGTAITLISDSGIVFDGYTWWEIELQSGEIAFQWGGVICVPSGEVSGVITPCP